MSAISALIRSFFGRKTYGTFLAERSEKESNTDPDSNETFIPVISKDAYLLHMVSFITTIYHKPACIWLNYHRGKCRDITFFF